MSTQHPNVRVFLYPGFCGSHWYRVLCSVRRKRLYILVTMTSIVIPLCILCETDAVGEEEIFIIDTECTECEVGTEAEETVEHWAYNTLHNLIEAL
jgi:hypothetical protein